MQNGAVRHESYMNKLKRNVEIRGKGGTAALTSGDAAFDATWNNGFKALIQRHKSNSGRAGKENSDIAAVVGDGSTGALNPSSPSASSNDTSATKSILESTSPTTTAARATKSILTSTSKAASIQKQPASTPRPPPSQKKKKSPPSACPPSRIVDVGPWKCTRCTYYNERNTTVKARCEMCDASREKVIVNSVSSRRQDVEVVNIDC